MTKATTAQKDTAAVSSYFFLRRCLLCLFCIWMTCFALGRLFPQWAPRSGRSLQAEQRPSELQRTPLPLPIELRSEQVCVVTDWRARLSPEDDNTRNTAFTGPASCCECVEKRDTGQPTSRHAKKNRTGTCYYYKRHVHLQCLFTRKLVPAVYATQCAQSKKKKHNAFRKKNNALIAPTQAQKWRWLAHFPQRGQVALDLTRSLAPRESLHSARSGCGLSSVWSDCVFLEALSSLIHRKDEGTRTIRPCRREGGPGVFCLFYDGCCRRSSR